MTRDDDRPANSADGDDERGNVFGTDVKQWQTEGGRVAATAHRHLADRIGTRGASLVGLAIGGVTVAATTAFAIVIYDGVSGRTGIARIDQPALDLGKRLRGPITNRAAGLIADGFGPIGMPILTAAAGLALARRRHSREPFALVAAAGTGSLLMTLFGKRIVKRNRPARSDAAPPYEHSPSFPSGHTINATSIVGTLAYLLIVHADRRRDESTVAAAAAGTILTVGASRILLGAHWFTDVVMGLTTGAGWLGTIITVHRLHATTSAAKRHRAEAGSAA